MVGVTTGALGQRMGSLRVAALSLVTVAAALALLGLASNSLTATMASACIFGMGYMTGSAVLAVWTAELVPDRAGAAFTACLVVGAISSVAAPALAGAVIPGLGLGTLLVITAAVSLLSGVALMLHGSSRGAAVARTRPCMPRPCMPSTRTPSSVMSPSGSFLPDTDVVALELVAGSQPYLKQEAPICPAPVTGAGTVSVCWTPPLISLGARGAVLGWHRRLVPGVSTRRLPGVRRVCGPHV
ncbi:MFS transporter [uncultured Kocuria sp.]|uniref:MFS transporter n=1 Tax=uncultured Kocuria sp. TaxID=259305 RepID=UPI003434747E